MRYLPAHAATSGSVPFTLRGSKPLRTAMATAVAGLIGLVPTVLIASPAHAAVNDLQITVAPATEGGAVVFTITRLMGSAASRTLTYSTVDDSTFYNGTDTGAGVGGTDYTDTNGTLTFAGNVGADEAQTISVPTTADVLDEYPEKFRLTVLETGVAAVFATGSPANLVGVINDDANDGPPSYTLTATPPTVAELEAAPATSTIKGTLSGPSGKPVGIALSTDNGTAKSGSDYTALNAVPLTFVPSDVEETTTVSVLGDGVKDTLDTEAFSVNGTGTNVSPTSRSVDVSITDFQATPKITLTGGGPVAEPNPGASSTFTVHLDHASEKDITVHWDAVAADVIVGHGVATPSDDFVSYPASGSRTVTLLAGDTAEDIVIPIKSDALDEASPEDFAVQLSAPVNADLGTPVKVAAQISDNAANLPPHVTVTPTAVDEGNSGYNARTFIATLDAPSGRAVSVYYSTNIDGVVGVGKALPGRDYVDKTGTLTFPAGTTTRTFTVETIGDLIDEGLGETFDIRLSDVDATATLTLVGQAVTQAGVVTITDDDAAPTFTVDDVAVKEMDAPGVALMPIKLSSASDTDVKFIVLNAPVQSDTAMEPIGEWWGSNDFDNPVTPVTIPAGQTTGYVLIYTNGDQIYETDETTHFSVAIHGDSTLKVTGATKTPKFTLTNDDLAPKLEINSVTGEEGDTAEVTGTVSGMAQADVNLNVTFAGGSSHGSVAASANDFTNPGATAVTIFGGTMPGTVRDVADVVLAEDTAKEPAETIIVNGIGLGNVGTVTEGIVTIAISDGGTDPTDPDSVTLAGPSSRVLAGPVRLTGMTDPATEVQLWSASYSGDDWTPGPTKTSSSTGAFLFDTSLTTAGRKFVVHAGETVSDEVSVRMRQAVTLAGTSTTRGVAALRVAGGVPGAQFRIQRSENGVWKTVFTGNLLSNGAYYKALSGHSSGKTIGFRAYVWGSIARGVDSGSSTIRYVRIR
jgi:hypothetical protein